ncbi:hypothetical protein [uncultured Selenomonas sp.]|uniref:hypothetical protein n=1 Tax=uncultured Selenomonas sp. TaxID=159275 RepID=UPI0025F1D46A|nr:hypothetical protein [uncultured Selenomonas sp.]
MANRQYKDTVFRMFMNDRNELAKFYQALRPEEVIRPEDIEINTLEDILLDQFKNDVSFTWKDQSIVLTEHQSTISPNIALRQLIYADRLLLGTVVDKKALYRRTPIYLPAPHFYTLYIGSDMKEDEKDVRLSDYFREKGSDLDLTCHVINITYKKDRAFLKDCQPIREYSFFVNRTERNQQGGMSLDNSIRESIDYCIHHKIMQSFLERNRREVLEMMMFQWNAEEAQKVYEEELAEATAKSKAEGEAEGKAKEKMTIIHNMLNTTNLSYEQIAQIAGTTVKEVGRIAKDAETAR